MQNTAAATLDDTHHVFTATTKAVIGLGSTKPRVLVADGDGTVPTPRGPIWDEEFADLVLPFHAKHRTYIVQSFTYHHLA